MSGFGRTTGGALTWQQDINDPLTDIGGGKVTATAGTLTADPTGLSWTTTGAGTVYALFTAGALTDPTFSILQVDVMMPAGVDVQAGVYFSGNLGSLSTGVRLDTATAGRVERIGDSNICDLNGSWPRGAWHTIRMLAAGGAWVGYVDGARLNDGTTFRQNLASSGFARVGFAINPPSAQTVKFRNLKAWSGLLGLPV